MLYLYDTILSRPLLNILVFFYNTIAGHDLGWAIIFLTILIRLVLFPLFQKSTRYQMLIQQIQPKLAQIKEEHKNDFKKQSEATMALYKENNINPFAGFLFLLIQLPILIALYRIFFHIFSTDAFQSLYYFIHKPDSLNTLFLGLINLQKANILLVILAGVAQYWQIAMTLPKRVPGQVPSKAEQMSRRFALFAPVLTLVIFFNLPAAVSLYWVVSSLLSVVQQYIINYQLRNGKLGKIRNKAS